MNASLYVRIRGRVLGPFEAEKLQGLAQRGQLSRMHELSPDGVTWVRASTHPELFSVGSTNLPGLTVDEPSVNSTAIAQGGTDAVANESPPIVAPPQAQKSAQWYYTFSGMERGPVDFAHLQMLAGTGQLGIHDLVWAEGMPTWTSANNIAGLIRTSASHVKAATPGEQVQSSSQGFEASGMGDRSARRGSSGDLLPEGLLRSVVSSRGWVTFIAVALFILSGLEAAVGIFTLARGARSPLVSNELVAMGVMAIILAVTIALGGLFLMNYVSRLGAVRLEPRAIVLEKAMDTLRAYWIYLAIFLIIILILLTIGVIVGLTEGARF